MSGSPSCSPPSAAICGPCRGEDGFHRGTLRLFPGDLQDLVSGSGLSLSTVCSSGFQTLPSTRVRGLCGFSWSPGGYLIPYPSLGRALVPELDLRANWKVAQPEMWRVRLRAHLQQSDRRSEEARGQQTRKKAPRYASPGGRAPEVYVPPLEPFLSGYLASQGPLIVTEGEKKALALTQSCRPVRDEWGCLSWEPCEPAPCIALGGVWNWKRKGGGDLDAVIPGLRRIPWRGRRTVLLYDSDITEEHPAYPAFKRLQGVLVALGADVEIRSVPALTDEKVDGEGGHGEDGR